MTQQISFSNFKTSRLTNPIIAIQLNLDCLPLAKSHKTLLSSFHTAAIYLEINKSFNAISCRLNIRLSSEQQNSPFLPQGHIGGDIKHLSHSTPFSTVKPGTNLALLSFLLLSLLNVIHVFTLFPDLCLHRDQLHSHESYRISQALSIFMLLLTNN